MFNFATFKIEEQILGTKAWESNSVLWEKLNNLSRRIPQSQDVALPDFSTNDSAVNNSTPISNPVVKKLSTTPSKLIDDKLYCYC